MRKLTMLVKVILSVGILLFQTVCPILALQDAAQGSSENTFSMLKHNHKLKTLTTEKLRKVVQRADYDRFSAYLQPMMIPRVSGTEGNKRVQKHITDSLEALGWSIDLDRFEESTPYGTKEFTNVVATQNPYAARKLALACHFDSKYFPGQRFIGMTDSAVPCAMLLDLAKSLDDLLKGNNRNKVQDVTLQLIFFDGEEAFKEWRGNDNTYGSRHLARQMYDKMVPVDREVTVREIETIDALVLLDLIGAKNPRFRSWFAETDHLFQRLQHIESRLLKSKLMEGQFGNKNVYFKSAARVGGHIEDDHVPFMKRQVPIVHLISHPFPDVWHELSDDENAMSPPDIVNLNNVMRVFVTEYLRLV